MDLDFVHTIGDDEEDVALVASSDEDEAEQAAAAAAKATSKRKKAVKRKRSKASQAAPSSSAYGSKTGSSFFSMQDFDAAADDEEATASAQAEEGKWDFESGISTRKTTHFDGLTSLRDKIREKRSKYSEADKAQMAGPPSSGDDSSGDDSGADSDGAGSGEGASGAQSSDNEEDDGSGSGSDSDEDGSADESGSDESGSDDAGDGSDAGSSDEEESSGGSSSDDNDADTGAARAAAAMEADRTRQLKERQIAPPEDAAGKQFFEADPFLNGNDEEITSFAGLHLSRPLLRAIADLGYKAPTPIQRRVIPLCLAGRDVCGSAVTGSGKTAAFLLPALERLLFRPKHIPATRVLIVTPTRELATQILSMTKKLAKYTDIRAALAVGGHSLKVQEADLRARPEIVVCTPGRIIDLLRNSRSVHVDDVDILIMDEADRLLEMGFKDEVEEIIKHCPAGRQTVLLSATMVSQVKELIALSLNKPVRVSADPLYDVAQRLSQEFVRIRENRDGDREAILVALVTRSFRKEVIVFCPTKKLAHRLTLVLGLAGVECGELHGDLTQQQRLDALNAFRAKQIQVLVATDLASRGLDIAGVRTVINYTMPRDLTRYVHRVGRTARAGRVGTAVTLTGERNRSAMRQIVKRAATNVKSRQVPPEVIEYWRAKIESFEDDVEDILRQESIEKELRVAQMEVMKASNMMEHQKDILSRPARTWFQTASEKAAVKRAVLDQLRNSGPKDGEAKTEAPVKTRKQLKAEIKAEAEAKAKRPHRLNRNKRRRLEFAAEDARLLKMAQRAGEDDKDAKKVMDAVLRDQKAQAAQRTKAKAAKSQARQAQMAMSATHGHALKVIQQGQGVPGKAKPVKVRAKDRSLFDADEFEVRGKAGGRRGKGGPVRVVQEAPSAGSQVSSGGNRYASVERKRDRSAGKRFTFKEQEARTLRKGGKPSRNAFKSKQRYNKRKR